MPKNKRRNKYPCPPFLRYTQGMMIPFVPFLNLHIHRSSLVLQSPGKEAVLACLVRLPGSLRFSVARAETDDVVEVLADAVEYYRLTREYEPDPDGWRDVSKVTAEEWLAWRWWERRLHPNDRQGYWGSHHMQSVPASGQVRPLPVLDWPEMSGNPKDRISSRDTTQAHLDAWPWWVVDKGQGPHVVPAEGLLVEHLAGEWQPLRLPGMSTDPETLGEIAAKDMTPEHFERVRLWCWHPGAGGQWSMPFDWSMNDVRPDVADERWRPAVFARKS